MLGQVRMLYQVWMLNQVRMRVLQLDEDHFRWSLEDTKTINNLGQSSSLGLA